MKRASAPGTSRRPSSNGSAGPHGPKADETHAVARRIRLRKFASASRSTCSRPGRDRGFVDQDGDVALLRLAPRSSWQTGERPPDGVRCAPADQLERRHGPFATTDTQDQIRRLRSKTGSPPRRAHGNPRSGCRVVAARKPSRGNVRSRRPQPGLGYAPQMLPANDSPLLPMTPGQAPIARRPPLCSTVGGTHGEEDFKKAAQQRGAPVPTSEGRRETCPITCWRRCSAALRGSRHGGRRPAAVAAANLVGRRGRREGLTTRGARHHGIAHHSAATLPRREVEPRVVSLAPTRDTCADKFGYLTRPRFSAT